MSTDSPCTCSAKKINSHRWALQAFAPQLDPRVVVLLDVGTKPAAGSLYKLWKAFDVRLMSLASLSDAR